MQRTAIVFSLITGLLVSLAAQAGIQSRNVSYQADGITMQGFLAYDDSIKGPRPGILVVHEWWGLNDYARQRARQLAELGYTALALDMYGDGKTASHPDDAGKFASAVNNDMAAARKRFEAAMTLLKQQPETNPEHIAAIGYCFGGGIVLNMARAGIDLDAVVSFHGSLNPTTTPPGQIKARIKVFHGNDDSFVPKEAVQAFRQEMEAAGADYDFVGYNGVRHSFTNPEADALGKQFDLPLVYNAAADKDSWNAMLTFLQDSFKD